MTAKKKKRKARKKPCDHNWQWLDCEEGLICTRPGCNMYSRDINDAPFGESKLLYMEMATHKEQVKKLTRSNSLLQIVAGAGWAFFIAAALGCWWLWVAVELSKI